MDDENIFPSQTWCCNPHIWSLAHALPWIWVSQSIRLRWKGSFHLHSPTSEEGGKPPPSLDWHCAIVGNSRPASHVFPPVETCPSAVKPPWGQRCSGFCKNFKQRHWRAGGWGGVRGLVKSIPNILTLFSEISLLFVNHGALSTLGCKTKKMVVMVGGWGKWWI